MGVSWTSAGEIPDNSSKGPGEILDKSYNRVGEVLNRLCGRPRAAVGFILCETVILDSYV